MRTIPNFVDTEQIRPGDRMTRYRQELGIGDEPVVLYAGNVGFSQSLDLLVAAARQLPDVTFLINGDGSMRARPGGAVRPASRNVRFGGFVPADRLGELLATGDLHVVPLRRGLAQVSVPSKTYSILAAGRPVLAAIDAGTTIPRLLAESGAGVSVAPDDPEQFTAAVAELVADGRAPRGDGRGGTAMGGVGGVPGGGGAATYEALIGELGGAPVAFRPRGSIILVDQEGRSPRPEGQGPARPLPGRHAVPPGRGHRPGRRAWVWSSTPGRRDPRTWRRSPPITGTAPTGSSSAATRRTSRSPATSRRSTPPATWSAPRPT